MSIHKWETSDSYTPVEEIVRVFEEVFGWRVNDERLGYVNSEWLEECRNRLAARLAGRAV